MEYLYIAQTIETQRDVRKMRWYFTLRNRKTMITQALSLCLGLFILFSGCRRDNLLLILLAGFYLAYVILLLPLSILIQTARGFQKAPPGAEKTQYEFYDTYMLSRDVTGYERVEYRELTGLRERRTAIYLLKGERSAYLLPKEDLPEGLPEFLRELGLKTQ